MLGWTPEILWRCTVREINAALAGLRIRRKQETLVPAALIVSHLQQVKHPKSAQHFLDAWTAEPAKQTGKPASPVHAFKGESKAEKEEKFKKLWASVEKKRKGK